MAKPARKRFSIGIDLGTSNCALAYLDLRDKQAESRILEIPQWDAAGRSVTLKVLPSFAYITGAPGSVSDAPGSVSDAAASGRPDGTVPGGKRMVGAFARDAAAREPGRVAFSAKSWLTHAGVDRQARILPWASAEISGAEKVSPVEASALYLEYLRAVWNQAMAAEDEGNAFDRQHIVITVPASFDQGAQKLTLEAARLAGYPAGVRLLEEPQAAFYAWLERHPRPEALQSSLGIGASSGSAGTGIAGEVAEILVCDIGGGTTDFSRFSVEFRSAGTAQIRRVAVSDHILLGGDNIDLAIARLLESRAAGKGESLEPSAWQRLVAESRQIKETALGALTGNDGASGSTGDRQEPAPEAASRAAASEPAPKGPASLPADGGKVYRVGIAGTGGNLFSQARTAAVTEVEIRDLIDKGFFPRVEAGDLPRDAGSGLREMGLPYAADSAVTRYLAGFLGGGKRIDAVLFNGGALSPAYLQSRLRDMIASWQGGGPPVILENRELDLAVARGAAWHGRNLALGIRAGISAGSGHGYYLEAASREKQESRYLVCLLPLGAEVEEAHTVGKLDLRLALNRPVEFRLYDSIHRPDDRAGNILKYSPDEFRELPPLRTVARLEESRARAFADGQVAVGIRTVLNGLGLLQVELVSSDKRLHPPARWGLEFDMRAMAAPAPLPDAADASKESGGEEEALDPERKAQAFAVLASDFPPGVLGLLEKAVARNRGAWPRSWLRQFWEPLHGSITKRGRSPEFEAAWLNAAGFFLRPGFGVLLDDFRIDQLWHVQALGMAHPRNKAVGAQYWLMWRRVAGGLSAKRQAEVFAESRPLIESHHKLAEEAVRMAGALERLDQADRLWLLDAFLQGVELRRDGHAGHYLYALGRILSRVPLHGGEESVLPPAAVERCFGHFREWDWSEARSAFLPLLFAQACRVTGHRSIDIPETLRLEVMEKMRGANANPALIRQVREFVPMEREDVNRLLGDALPLGLAIGKFS